MVSLPESRMYATYHMHKEVLIVANSDPANKVEDVAVLVHHEPRVQFEHGYQLLGKHAAQQNM